MYRVLWNYVLYCIFINFAKNNSQMFCYMTNILSYLEFTQFYIITNRMKLGMGLDHNIIDFIG